MYIETTEIRGIINAIDGMNPGADEVLFIMIGEKNMPDLHRLVDEVNKRGHLFFGGIFPGLIYGNRRYEEGVIITRMKAKSRPHLVTGLDGDKFTIPAFEELEDTSSRLTAIVLVDGLTSNISGFLSSLFNKLGSVVNYLGGGGGSLSLVQQPCLFTNEGVFQDAAIVTIVDAESELGVKHGWELVQGQFVATKTEKNIVRELNWQNAFEVYKAVVEQDSGKEIRPDNFFDVAKAYPFGISREGEEYIVRDPLMVNENGALICVGEVPENTVLDILKGNTESLIHAAKTAATCCDVSDIQVKQALVFDCISRVLFLEEEFNREINEVYQVVQQINQEVLPQGVLTLGEISSHQGYLEFLNKTIVIGLLS